jgi:hypothetical protein
LIPGNTAANHALISCPDVGNRSADPYRYQIAILKADPIAQSDTVIPTRLTRLAVHLKDMDPTAAAYQGLPQVDKVFYDRVRESETRQLVQDFTIPIRTGQAWKVSSTYP